jgi:hypothetical protein
MNPSVSIKRKFWYHKTRDAADAQTRAQLAEQIKKEEQRKETLISGGCRMILKVHHEEMKDDPERLTTKFIAKMVGCKCRRVS